VGLAPTNTRAFANLANILMLRGDFSGAVETWLKILDIDINYPELYSKIGQCYNRMGQIDKAIEIQTRGLRLPENRNNASLYHGLANSYRLANRPDEAIWALEQSLKIRPDPRLKILLQRWNAERRS
jgi:tetratricopeptide (TPR) repeat protein